MPDRDWWALLWPDPKGVLQQLGIQPDMTVLDLWCSDGYFTAPLAKLVDGKVYALDLDLEMIGQAKVEAFQQGVLVRRWLCADAREISKLLREPVDYVLMTNTFHGVPDQTGLVRAVLTTLRRQGLFGLVNWLPLPREETNVLNQPRGPRTEMRMAFEAVNDVVASEGFRCVDLVELPPYHYGAVF